MAEVEAEANETRASLERRLRSMRTTRKERAEMEIAAMHKQFKEQSPREEWRYIE